VKVINMKETIAQMANVVIKQRLSEGKKPAGEASP
jgi:hypothetical protein